MGPWGQLEAWRNLGREKRNRAGFEAALCISCTWFGSGGRNDRHDRQLNGWTDKQSRTAWRADSQFNPEITDGKVLMNLICQRRMSVIAKMGVVRNDM